MNNLLKKCYSYYNQCNLLLKNATLEEDNAQIDLVLEKLKTVNPAEYARFNSRDMISIARKSILKDLKSGLSVEDIIGYASARVTQDKYGVQGSILKNRMDIYNYWKSDSPYQRVARSVKSNLAKTKAALKESILRKIYSIPIYFGKKEDNLEVLRGEDESIYDTMGGFYNPNKNFIWINAEFNMYDKNLKLAIAHELGHAIFAIIQDKYPQFERQIKYLLNTGVFAQQSYAGINDPEYRVNINEQFARLQSLKQSLKIRPDEVVTAKDLFKKLSFIDNVELINGIVCSKEFFVGINQNKHSYYIMSPQTPGRIEDFLNNLDLIEKGEKDFSSPIYQLPVSRKDLKHSNLECFILDDDEKWISIKYPTKGTKSKVTAGNWSSIIEEGANMSTPLEEVDSNFLSNFKVENPAIFVAPTKDNPFMDGDKEHVIYCEVYDLNKIATAFNQVAAIDKPTDTAVV